MELSWKGLLVTAATVLSMMHTVGATQQLVPDLPIYTSGTLSPRFADSSYNGGRLPDSTSVVAGGAAVAFSPVPWAGVQFYVVWPYAPLDARKYDGIAFKLAAASSFVPDVDVGLQVKTPWVASVPKGVPLKRYLAGGRALTAWQHVFVPLADLNASTDLATVLSLYWATGSVASTNQRQQPTIYLESIALVALPPACPCAVRPPPPPPPPQRSPPPARPPPPRPRPPPPAPPAPPLGPRGLHTDGNGIYWADGKRFTGRGVNLFDTRSCGACLGSQNVSEVKRRIDFAVTQMGASLLRMVLETRVPDDPTDTYNGWQYCVPNCSVSTAYLDDIKELVRYAGATYGHVQVLLSLWATDYAWGNTPEGWPTDATIAFWRRIVAAVGQYAYVWFGVVNEPQSNFDGAQDAQVWTAMNTAVAAIRHQEAALGQAPHIITVQGTRGWARDLSYYVTHPVTAGQGANVVYETHVYNPAADLGGLFVKPSATLPILIGEFGPAAGYMSLADSEALMQKARNLSLPWTGWSLHMRCDPSMLQDLSGGGCGIGMALKLTPWGTLVQKYLQMP